MPYLKESVGTAHDNALRICRIPDIRLWLEEIIALFNRKSRDVYDHGLQCCKKDDILFKNKDM